jgi:hypothetical protein
MRTHSPREEREEVSINKTSYTPGVCMAADYSGSNKIHIFVTIKDEKCEREGTVRGETKEKTTRGEPEANLLHYLTKSSSAFFLLHLLGIKCTKRHKLMAKKKRKKTFFLPRTRSAPTPPEEETQAVSGFIYLCNFKAKAGSREFSPIKIGFMGGVIFI